MAIPDFSGSMHFHEIEVFNYTGFYFHMPSCEIDRDDIDIYVDLFGPRPEHNDYLLQAWATIHDADVTRYLVFDTVVSANDFAAGFEGILEHLNETPEFLEGVQRFVAWIETHGK